jgi:hypothetical protein
MAHEVAFIVVGGYEDLVAMKQGAGRPQDETEDGSSRIGC